MLLILLFHVAFMFSCCLSTVSDRLSKKAIIRIRNIHHICKTCLTANNKVHVLVHEEPVFFPSYFQSAVCLSTLVTSADINLCVGKHAQTPECEAVW